MAFMLFIGKNMVRSEYFFMWISNYFLLKKYFIIHRFYQRFHWKDENSEKNYFWYPRTSVAVVAFLAPL